MAGDTISTKHINSKTNSLDVDWVPWEQFFPGAPPVDGDYGGWVKVLRAPNEDERGWTFLFKWVGHPNYKTRLKAVVPDDGEEHVYVTHAADDVIESMEGIYTFRGPGALHSDVFGDSFVAFLRYTTEPDTILSYEVIDR